MSIDLGNGVSVGRRQDAELERELTGQPLVPRDIQRATGRAVAKQYGKAVVGAARVRTIGYVTDHGCDVIDALEAREAAAAARNPMTGGYRHRDLVDRAHRAIGRVIDDTGDSWR